MDNPKMCNCKSLPSKIMDISYSNQDFKYEGEHEFSSYFDFIDSEELSPNLDYSENYYKCLICNQYWYIECAPEETPFSLFAIKIDKKTKLSNSKIMAEKNFLAILAHNGFSSEQCRYSGCNNQKLKGRELCYLHISLI